ncbi:CPBP family intramembrane glutamic endopeptidase [uncultured Enterococcus sp.]|uniref:CPBP family intramembrane glutamic endopeptidase n=1 Tax=uncultured Enterococcus sp. TaxID=167972 RepID=UPI002AA7D53E|nr:CPBP family intramembrane glutamic endopeptidase [uncultured Enterococcus sp.]
MNWKNFFRTITVMWGTFLLYKTVSLSLLYSLPNLQSKSYYEFIYFLIVSLISIFIISLAKNLFASKISFSPKVTNSKKNILIFIVPFILFGIDFIGGLADIFRQPFYLIIVSFASALGAALFEEIRDRGFGTIGFDQSFPSSKWKPLIITICTSFLFSTTHYLNLLMPIAPSLEAVHQQVFYTFFMGMVFSVLTMRTGSIFYPIFFHFINNLVPWTPTSDLSSVSSWGNLLVIYGVLPLFYTLWCLRPSKMLLKKKFEN